MTLTPAKDVCTDCNVLASREAGLVRNPRHISGAIW